MIDLASRSLSDLEKSLKHIERMEGIVEQDARDLPNGDFSHMRDLFQRGRAELEAEIDRRVAQKPS